MKLTKEQTDLIVSKLNACKDKRQPCPICGGTQWIISDTIFEISSCRGFVSIVALIFFGQILIVELGGAMFNVVPLSISDWLITVGATSLVLWIGEFVRLVCPAKKVTC